MVGCKWLPLVKEEADSGRLRQTDKLGIHAEKQVEDIKLK